MVQKKKNNDVLNKLPNFFLYSQIALKKYKTHAEIQDDQRHQDYHYRLDDQYNDKEGWQFLREIKVENQKIFPKNV